MCKTIIVLFYLVWTRDVETPAVLFHPCCFPDLPVGVFVDVTTNHSRQRDEVEHREYSHSNHELDQFGLVFFLQRNLHAYLI